MSSYNHSDLVVDNPDGTKTITLAYPVELANGEAISKVTLRRAKVRDLESMDTIEGTLGKSAVLISQLCEVPMKVVHEMDAEDFSRLDTMITEQLKGKKPGSTGGK